METLEAAQTALRDVLKDFMSIDQRATLAENIEEGGCEEHQYFRDLVVKLATMIADMPQTYDQDGKGKDAIATLHYFAGGQANWYITEKDKGDVDDAENGTPPQSQAFGLADLFGDGGELGYISIHEIITNRGELDFHFTPKTLNELTAATSN
jgi:hypothetical protein